MLGFEKRWATAVLSGFAPEGGDGLAPRRGEVDFAGTMEQVVTSAGPRAGMGFRAALWAGALAPVWMWRWPCTAGALSQQDRARMLDAMLHHRSYVARELALLLKVAASMALLGTGSVRARSGYDGRLPEEPEEDLLESGERMHLPVLEEEVA